jgi:hypothetical protein
MASESSPSPATVANFIRPFVDGNQWLIYDYHSGINKRQILKYKKLVQALAKAKRTQIHSRTSGPHSQADGTSF